MSAIRNVLNTFLLCGTTGDYVRLLQTTELKCSIEEQERNQSRLKRGFSVKSVIGAGYTHTHNPIVVLVAKHVREALPGYQQ